LNGYSWIFLGFPHLEYSDCARRIFLCKKGLISFLPLLQSDCVPTKTGTLGTELRFRHYTPVIGRDVIALLKFKRI